MPLSLDSNRLKKKAPTIIVILFLIVSNTIKEALFETPCTFSLYKYRQQYLKFLPEGGIEIDLKDKQWSNVFIVRYWKNLGMLNLLNYAYTLSLTVPAGRLPCSGKRGASSMPGFIFLFSFFQ